MSNPHSQLLKRLRDKSATIGIVGLGYVGLPLLLRYSEAGFKVLGLDVDQSKVNHLNGGKSYIAQFGSDRVAQAREAGMEATTDSVRISEADAVIICVPTPLNKYREPDLRFVVDTTDQLAPHLRAGQVVSLESTTYPGTTAELLGPILEEASGLGPGDFLLGYSPERIDPGNQTHTFVNTPKVTSGVDDASLAVVDAFFGALVDQTVPVGSPAEAELVKLLENTFRHVNIALVNELAMFARELGVDVWRAIDAASTKPFGYMRFTPGPGVGGHCLPIDPSYLAWRVKQHLGHTFRFVELANDVNEHMPDYVHARVTALLNQQRKSLNGSKVLLLGLAYKRGTSDWRESPSVVVADRLAASGAELEFCDPHIPEVNARSARFPLVDFGPDTLGGADVVVVLVDHPEFDPATIAEHSALVFDAKNIMRGTGFTGEIL